MRPAKKERPFTTASPDSAEATTASRVETTRGSNTTVQCAERAFWAPSIRVARSDGVVHRLVGHEVTGSRGRR